jgi:hypothetical protein
MNMIPSKKSVFAILGATAMMMMMTGCAGIQRTSTGGGGGGGGTGPFTVGGTVIGLLGTGLVLNDNSSEDLPITGTGASIRFTFKTAVTGKYAVTVKTQPSNPAQSCSVSGGTGTAAANVTSVQITCGTVVTIGGTVSGLTGTGLVLLDNGGDPLTVTGTGMVNFTFPTPLSSGVQYAVTVGTQPTNPGQTCTVSNGSGTANSNINTVQVLCPQPTFTIGGTVVGLVSGPGDTVELQNNGGDNIFVTGNNQSFTFPTPVTNNGAYNVSMFFGPASQPQICWLFYYTGVAKANVSDVLVDCQHNDWTWMAGPQTSNQFGALTLPPPSAPATNTNTPGGREYPATWSGPGGRKWLFGGYGKEVAGKTPPDLPGLLNDLWYWQLSLNGVAAWVPAGLPISTSTTSGVTTNTAVINPTQNTNNCGITTGSAGPPPTAAAPGARYGSVTWTDGSGNLWLFGGAGYTTNCVGGLLNDLWEFVPGKYDVSVPPNYVGSYSQLGTWTNVSGGTNVDQGGNYTVGGVPGGRWGAAYYTDAAGTVWMFGGQGFDSTGTLGLLSDLWKYSGGQWTPVAGSQTGQKNGVYGTLGTPLAPGAVGPGGRQTAVLWADNAGNIWLFGGLGLDSVGTNAAGSIGGLPNGTVPNGALLNDLWKYNIGTNQWTWVAGGGATGLANQNGVYGSQQISAAGNVPGSRWSAAGWTDAKGNIWLFGGWGYASSLAKSTGFLNDTWEFHPATGQWTWWKGSSDVNQNGSYPTQFTPSIGVPFINNVPGARRGFGFWQADGLDYVWVFGGQGYDSTSTTGNGYLNDLWTYLQFPY